jgi:Dihydroorotase and related cyclic amidohydrolases
MPPPGSTGISWSPGGKIAAIQDRIEIGNLSVEETDLQGAYVSPGLVDAHVHFIGATWDDGFTSKTPEIFISDFLRGGVTTAVGCWALATAARISGT